MFELGNIQRTVIAIVGAIIFTGASVLAAAAPAETAPTAAYAAVHDLGDARG